LFQLQEPKVFKAFSKAGNIGLLGAWNFADSDLVKGIISPNDIAGIQGDNFIIYEYFSQKIWKLSKNEKIEVELPRMGYQLFFIFPTDKKFVAIGLIDKYNSPGTIVSQKSEKRKLTVIVADHGIFGVISPKKPKKILLDGRQIEFTYDNELVIVDVEKEEVRRNHEIEIFFDKNLKLL
jgi:raffinose synthase